MRKVTCEEKKLQQHARRIVKEAGKLIKWWLAGVEVKRAKVLLEGRLTNENM